MNILILTDYACMAKIIYMFINGFYNNSIICADKFACKMVNR